MRSRRLVIMSLRTLTISMKMRGAAAYIDSRRNAQPSVCRSGVK